MIKLLTIIGNRPHFIKAAHFSRLIKKSEDFTEVIVHTGQHYDPELAGNFIKELDLPKPTYNLEIGSDRPLIQMAKILLGLDDILQEEQPDAIIVYGDTNSTAAGAIAAAKSNLPLAHIEAGLREFDKQVPEEINKLLTDAVADFHFCPTQTAMDILAGEGKSDTAYLVGDVGLDLIKNNIDKIDLATSILTELKLQCNGYYFVTCHRQNNTDNVEHLKQILTTLAGLDRPVVFPIHPRTQHAIDRYNLIDILDAPHIIKLKPIGFWQTQALIRHAHMCITDSGGVIKEAYVHKVPAIIIDRQTEWVETIREGWNQVTGPDAERIHHAIRSWVRPGRHDNSIGDGTACRQILNILRDKLPYVVSK
ncbi:UNVERIFIED_CONTAM: hypothetical protein GTU68_019867 [Idotea baltica]|nr:hypothetical protein [Idotea baltica]